MSVIIEKQDSSLKDRLTVIASSTGGPKALRSVIPYFPKNYPTPIVVIQHMPEGFTASLANRLDALSPLKVKEAEDGELLRKGVIYIAPGGKQCELIQKKTGVYCLSVSDKPARSGLHPCADVFFESVIPTAVREVFCGVLTGMGSDACEGIRQIKKVKKVMVVAQDEATCVVYGMPRAVRMAGLADEVVPLPMIASTIIKKIGV